MPVTQINCFGKSRASSTYKKEKTMATTRTKTKRMMVLVSSEKLLLPSYIPPPLTLRVLE